MRTIRRVRPYDGMLIGTPTGDLLRVFDPPWWRVDRWLRWWSTALFDRIARAADRILRRPPRPAIARGFAELGGAVVRVEVDRKVDLPNVPRKKR